MTPDMGLLGALAVPAQFLIKVGTIFVSSLLCVFRWDLCLCPFVGFSKVKELI